MALGVLTLQLHLAGCSSLKEKRSRIKPLLARLHREFNVSVAEVDRQDSWQEAVLACALISSDGRAAQRALQKVAKWVDQYWPDVTIMGEHIEMI